MRFIHATSISLSTFPASVFMLRIPLITTPSPAGLPLPLNVSVSSLNTSANDEPPIYCQGSKLGFNLNVPSCTNALAYLPKIVGLETLSFGARGRGIWDVNVPNRYLSCMSPNSDATNAVH